MKDFKEVVSEIQSLNAKLADGKVTAFNGDSLSALAVKLASYNVLLGEYRAKLSQEADQKEAGYKYAFLTTYETLRDTKEDGKTKYSQEDAKNKAELEVQTSKADYLNAKHAFELTKQLSQDTSNVISTLQSRIKVLTQQFNQPQES